MSYAAPLSHNIDVDTNPSYNQPQSQGFLAGTKHPVTVIFHCIFKIAAIIMWFCSGAINRYVISVVVILVLLSCDFWVVKNVSGRLLVGLRWWNEVKDNGDNEWIFESIEDKTQILPLEKAIFWGALFVNTILWVLFLVLTVLSFTLTWLMVVIIAVALNIANISGYIKCARQTRQQLKGMATSYMINSMINRV
eukprot:TRINITY_DN3344_c0_g1_i1.p1 TRINITY_DN3344_c0_g1~~TRINITY_DN3344_c0_g1_i1.p1  ORF type:complete len:194 (+),score=49.35 TRINITY_DN3344_c0_g1_i1:762-1343(+)